MERVLREKPTPTFSHIALGLALLLTLHATPLPAAQPDTPAPALSETYGPELAQLLDQGDLPGLERLSREFLAQAQARSPPSEADLASAENWLGNALKAQGRYAEAEPHYRLALAEVEHAFGPHNPNTATVLDALAVDLKERGQFAQAEPLYRRALAIREQALGRSDVETAKSLNNLARLFQEQGRDTQAEPLLRRALAITEAAQGADDPDVATILANIGLQLDDAGRYAEAEPLLRRALAIDEQALGQDQPQTARSMNNLAFLLQDQGRGDEAEPLFRRALAVNERMLGADHPITATALDNLAFLLQDQARYAEAEPLTRRALAIREAALGPDHPRIGTSLNNLALLLMAQQRYGEAEPLMRRALAISERGLGPDSPSTTANLDNLAALLRDQGRDPEAEPLLRRALAVRERVLGPDHPDTAVSRIHLADFERRSAHFDRAADQYRRACEVFASRAGPRGAAGEGGRQDRASLAGCLRGLALVLRQWAEHGGGPEGPGALRDQAFTAVQGASASLAGEALARAAALTAAKAAGIGDQAGAYEDALADLQALDRQYSQAADEAPQSGDPKHAALSGLRLEIVARIGALAATISAKAPRYWDYRAPAPVTVAALQARVGPDAALLRDNEALVVVFIPAGAEPGLVFAVSKERAGWARLGMGGDDLRARVAAIRAGVERVTTQHARAFDRRGAFALHQALLGDPSIQAVIGDKSVLLFVPSGPLTSLPPGLLVTAAPQGGVVGDSDPAALRATPWLLRAKAVALLPSVASLRMLRQLNRDGRGAADDPVLVFADPDFQGPVGNEASSEPPARPAEAPSGEAPRGFASYFRGGQVMAEDLRRLPRLAGTRVEGEALEAALGGRAGSLLTGANASKGELMRRNADGRLARVRVLEFATHGLVAGAANWLAEPALALAAGARPDDELLLASEATTLKLNAEWVVLSACNTASREAPEAQGLSGLSRAFFYAGAQTLLVSHWSISDAVTARLIPATLRAARAAPAVGRAEALRRASLAILDDPTLGAANPAFWAPFTLVGEAEE